MILCRANLGEGWHMPPQWTHKRRGTHITATRHAYTLRRGIIITATRHATSLQKTPRRMVTTGGEIFARTAKTPHPTVRRCGDIIALQNAAHCRRRRAHSRPPMETHGFYHNAAPLGRALASGRVYSRVGGHSLRSAPPLPRT